MQALGIDCSAVLTLDLARKFKANGIQFVGRYVTPNSWKSLTKPEADNIITAGLQILSVFERTADRTKGGAVNGAEDGKMAYSQAKAVGQPEGTTIYFAVDYDAPASQYDNIEAYLRAAAKQASGYKIGVYGSYYVIEEMYKRGAADYFWQTIAWSKGQISSHVNVFQKQIDVQVNGIGIDWNDLYSDAGLWGAQPKEDVKKVDQQTRDINQVSPWAADSWREVTENGYFDGKRPGDTITREESGMVINRLRKNFLKLIGGNAEQIADLEKRLQIIESEGDK